MRDLRLRSGCRLGCSCVNLMRQFDVQLRDASGAVGGQREVEGSPSDVNVRVVIHRFRISRYRIHAPDRAREIGKLDRFPKFTVNHLPAGQIGKLA